MNLYIVVLPAKVLTDGTHKIRIAISHNSETRYKITRFRVPSVKNVRNGKVIGKDIDAEYINRQLGGIIQSMYRAYDEITDAECYTCSQLLNLIESKMNNSRPVTFEDISSEWLSHKVKHCSKGSLKLYRRSIDSFVEFFGASFILSTLRPIHINKYDDYLVGSNALKKDKTKYQRVLSPSSINLRMSVLRYIVKYAKERKYVDYDIDPFIDYKKRKVNVRDIFLPVEVIRSLRDANLEGIEGVCRDIFMLSFYLCGINLGDMLSIDLSKSEVSFVRIKTQGHRKDNTLTTFTIQPEARTIIDKYIKEDGRVMFDSKTNKNTLSHLLEYNLPIIAKEIGYEGRLIFYCARKSFAQYANELGIREKVIKYCLGNSIDQNDMITFYTRTNKQMADDAIRKVLDFVASNLSEEELF